MEDFRGSRPPKTTHDIKGRGASSNPPNRYEKFKFEFDPSEENLHNGGVGSGDDLGERPLLRTEFLRDVSRTIVTENTSPDIGFRFSINAYRGCEHGCAYCYARPTHEYLGLSAGIDFESKIFVKEEAPMLLREKLQLTRKCVEVLLEFRNPVGLSRKSPRRWEDN